MRYFITLLIFAGLLPGIANADVLPDNHHVLQSCLQIDNVSEYPDYDFVLSGNYKFSFSKKITDKPTCDLGGDGTILAIKKADWKAVKYAPKGSEEEGDWSMNPVNASLFIPSDIQLSFDTSIPDTDSTVSKTYTVHLDTVSADGIQARLTKTDTADKNGNTKTILEKPKQALVQTPIATNKQTSAANNSTLPMVAMIVVALGVAGLALSYRSWKK